MTDTLVFWILGPLFLAVGLYLIWYARRRKKMLESFARSHGLSIRPGIEKELQAQLDRGFSLEPVGLIRSFGQISSIVDGGAVRLFRTVELLDLNPHGQAYSTHFNRIAALFPAGGGRDEYFILEKSGRATPMRPGGSAPPRELAESVGQIAASCHARHTLSVTLVPNGHGLIYFIPLVTGGENLDDINALYCIARKLADTLGE